jgi:glycosyltransferase involved in cell wall biosynthesis
MWNNKTVSIILPTYNEKDSIRQSIESFQYNHIADEIIVVNNNAATGTSEEVAKTFAREVFEIKQGYGAAIRRGFKESTGEYIIVAEPDGTFVGRDIVKLLAYADDYDVVYGSRTIKELIWQGANMGYFLKWGNYCVAKMMEFLFNTVCLTDVGCTMRCINKNALRHIEKYFTVDGSFFGPEMMLLSIIVKMKIVQLPINYTKRIGKSSVTGNKIIAFILGLKMIGLILKYRINTLISKHRFKIYKPER